MDGYLTKLSDRLAPSEGFLTHADDVMNNLMEVLKVNVLKNITFQECAGFLDF